MSVFQRAATLAALSLSLVALIGTSTPGLAFELDSTARANLAVMQPVQAAPVNNIPGTDTVPTPAPSGAVVQPVPAEDEDFASLTEAVAAQDATAGADDALRCLAGAIYFEAKGEPLSGQLAVAEVIINRTKSGSFPTDLCGVVKQRGQFGFVRGGRIPSIDEERASYRTALAVAKVAMNDAWESPANDALYFHARRVAPNWGKAKVASIGNHIFYR
jgi:spore germination cell wall hydrolase CwlJ-like protein